VIVVGTDPVLSILIAGFWRLIRPNTRIVHWCFDLFPEAAVAEGLLAQNGLATKLIRVFLRGAYRSCSLIADLGPCMREALMRYGSSGQRHTLVPWALEEAAEPLPDDAHERAGLFGDAKLALLYSGSFGRAHSYSEILDLAQLLEPVGGRMRK
jgi:hypothetical protein